MSFSENYSNWIVNLGYHAFLDCFNSTESYTFHCLRTTNFEKYFYSDHKKIHFDIGKYLDALMFTLLI